MKLPPNTPNPFEGVFQDLPEDADAALNKMAVMGNQYREALAKAAAPVVFKILKKAKDLDDIILTSKAINEFMGINGIAISHPDTGDAFMVTPKLFPNDPEKGFLCLQSKNRSKNHGSGISINKLKSLELMVAPREEALAADRGR